MTSLAGGQATVVETTADVKIDGVLDEAAWQTAPPVTDFLRFQPTEGGTPSGNTQVRFLQDARNLYVGVTVSNTDYPVRARISRREDINADDQIGVYLDTFRDQRTGYIFYFNGRGIQQDIRVGPGFASFDWNTVLRTKGRATDDGYVLEVAIPWRSIKYPQPEEGDQTWGLILTRKIPSEGAKYSFPVTERNHPRIFTQAAPLTGVRPPRRGSGLELIPSLTVVQQATRNEADELEWVDLGARGRQGRRNWAQVVRPSLDARLGLTPNLGLAATVNPDFSQVDQDPTFIDLNQRFAFFYPERRPFFLDGTEYFADQHSTLYSRSVVDPIYGAKLSGRAGSVSMGVLHSLDRSPAPSVNERGSEGFTVDDVEGAMGLSNLARVRVDAFGDGYVGGTIADKRILDDSGAQRGVHSSAGMDTRIPLGERWTVDGRIQQSLTGRDLNQARWGQEVGLGVQRSGGIGWGMYANLTDVTPNHRSELGFLTQSGISYANTGLNYTFEPKGAVDTFTPGVDFNGRLERNGEQQQRASASADLVVNGIHRAGLSVNLNRIKEGIDADPAVRPDRFAEVLGPGIYAYYSAELGRVLAVSADGSLQRSMDFRFLEPANANTARATVTLRPTAGLRLDTTVRGDQLVRLARPDGRAGLIRHWTSWQFTQELGLRSMVEYSTGNERDDRLVSTVLLTWLENPGTAVHLGWIERTDLQGRAKAADRAVFAKVSVLFRP